MKRTESHCALDGFACMTQFAKNIVREFPIEDTPYRVDLKGELANGEYALCEVKAFNDNLAPYAEAIMQAASYADAIRYPVFIGPVRAGVMEINNGHMDNALGAFATMASRLNVGFMFVNHYGVAGLMLRGQRIVDAAGIKPSFGRVWYHAERHGSKQVRS